MIITGIELIRGEATYCCECIECGYLLESTEHCSGLLCPRCGGQMRRAERPGPGQPSSIGVTPPGKLELTYGDRLQVDVGLEYKGPRQDATLYGAIGVRGIGFNEKVVGEAPVTFDQADTFAPWSGSVQIPITADIAPGTNYDLYCKIKEFPDAGKPEVRDVIDITGMPPTFELLEETIYPYAYIYEGPHDGGTFIFKTDPFTPASWVAGRLAQACEDEVRKAGGKMLEMRVYVDKSPLLWSDWRIEVVSAPPNAGAAMSLGIAWWAIAILAALAIVLIIVITWAAKEIAGLFKRKPGLDQVKVGWTKETLILCIQDSEEYWDRTPTPVETLQGMSEEELRHYLNQIAEEEVPPTEGLGLGLAVAAVGVVGLGALAAMAMARPKGEGRREG